MKRIISIALILSLCIGLATWCKKITINNNDEKKISAVTTIFPQYDFTREISGDMVNLNMLIAPGAETHSYEPTPQDIMSIQNSDLFIYVGGESDTWIKSILSSMDTSNKKIISLMDCVDALEEENDTIAQFDDIIKNEDDEDEIEQKTDSEDIDIKEYDEHVWTSPINAIKIVKKITGALCELDPDNASNYTNRMYNYIDKLTNLDEEFKSVVANSKRKVLAFGDRFPFRYFVDEYSLNYYAAFPGCASQTETSAAKIAYMIEKIRENDIPVVLKIELSNGNIAESIAEATGTNVKTFYSCHNAPKKDFDSGATYIGYMKQNLETLKEALN